MMMKTYDENSNIRRSALQDRQIEERASLRNSQSASLARTESENERFYGENAEHLEAEIERLAERLNQPGLRGALTRIMSGSSDREQLECASKSLESIHQRTGERLGAVETTFEQRSEGLGIKHDLQKELLEMDIEKDSFQENKEIQPPEPAQPSEFSNTNSPGRSL